MKNLSLFVDDIDESLDPALVRKIQAICRNVKITPAGYLLRGSRRDEWPGNDWRHFYRKLMQKLFPQAWVYRGGHHLAIHASPPAEPSRCRPEPGAEAGRTLFRILEVRKLYPLNCGIHHGETKGAKCHKCSRGITAGNVSQQRDRALVAALEPIS